MRPKSSSSSAQAFCQSWAIDVARFNSAHCTTDPAGIEFLPYSADGVAPERGVKRRRLSSTFEGTLSFIPRHDIVHCPTTPSRGYSSMPPAPSDAPSTPIRNKRKYESDVPCTAGHAELEEDDVTPRPPAPTSRISFPSQTFTFPPPTASESSSKSTTNSQQSSKKSQSRSPKKGTLLRSLDVFEFLPFESATTANFPDALFKMRSAIVEYRDGLAVLPIELRESIINNSNFKALINEDHIQRDAFFDRTETRKSYGKILTIKEAEKLIQRSKNLTKEFYSEAMWNATVHFPLLEMASGYSPVAKAVHCQLMTSATIQPSDLLPKLDAETSTSRKLDVAITLELSPNDISCLQSRRIASVNPTYYPPACFRPIAVNIETKIPDAGFASGQTQLAVWLFAQFAQLRRVCGRNPPFLPLLLAQGNIWTFLAATQELIITDEGPPKYKTIIWDRVVIGNTSTWGGLWKVFAVLQYLIAWSVNTYTPWMRMHLQLE